MWAKLDDGLFNHPKILHAAGVIKGRHAAGVALGAFAAGVLYASDKLTDGFIPQHMVDTWAYGDATVVKALVEAGLWEVCPGGFWIHDWLDWNPSAEEVKAKRKADADRKKSRRGVRTES